MDGFVPNYLRTLLVSQELGDLVEDLEQPLGVSRCRVKSKIFIIEIVNGLGVNIAEDSVPADAARKVEDGNLSRLLSELSSVLRSLCSHENVKKIVPRVPCESLLTPQAENEICELPGPSIALLLRG